MKEVFTELKGIDTSTLSCQLAIIHTYNRNRESVYKIKYVKIDGTLERKLKRIVHLRIEKANTFEEYKIDKPVVDEDQTQTIKYESTDFYEILDQLVHLDPEVDVVTDIEELIKTDSYLIVLRNIDGIKAIGFKKLPENWKLKRKKGLIPLLFKDEVLEDLETVDIFNISSNIDFIYFEEVLFILSTKNFEQGLNFRQGMISKAETFYDEVRDSSLFVNLELLTAKVGNNLRYLRKIATVSNLGYYKDQTYLSRLKEVAVKNDWNIRFENSQMILTEDNLDEVLTVLQNKRLHSEITEETFDVDSAKIVPRPN